MSIFNLTLFAQNAGFNFGALPLPVKFVIWIIVCVTIFLIFNAVVPVPAKVRTIALYVLYAVVAIVAILFIASFLV